MTGRYGVSIKMKKSVSFNFLITHFLNELLNLLRISGGDCTIEVVILYISKGYMQGARIEGIMI